MSVHLVADGIPIRTVHTSRLTKQARMPDKAQYSISTVANRNKEKSTVLCYNIVTEYINKIQKEGNSM